MARLIADRFLVREEKKRAELEQLAPPPEKLKEGSRILVHFPYIKRSKLFSPWKGIYKIVEIIDKNCYVVQEETEERKKFIVDRRRIRLLGPKLKIEDLEVMDPIEECELESTEEPTTEPVLEKAPENQDSEQTFMTSNVELEPVLDERNNMEPEFTDKEEKSGENLEASKTKEWNSNDTEEVPIILEDVADRTAKEQGLQYESTGTDCQIEFEIPDKSILHHEDDRFKRKAARKARSNIRKWTKELLN